MAHDELHALVGLLDVDEPIVVVMRHDPHPAAQRLLVSLGCGWTVDPVNGVRCAKACGQKECRVVARTESPQMRRIRENEERRKAQAALPAGFEHGEDGPVEVKRWCSRCKTFVLAGRDNLCVWCDQPTVPAADVDVKPVLGEAAAVGELAESGSAAADLTPLLGEPERAATSPITANPYGLKKFGRGYIWTRDAAIAAVKAFREEHGRAPQLKDFGSTDGSFPSSKSVSHLFSGIDELVRTAGLEPAGTNAPRRPGVVDRGVTSAWTFESVVEAIQRWNTEHGAPPTANAWARRQDGYPSASTVSKHLGSWANAIEAAGFDRPRQGGATVQPEQTVKWIKVNGTGLAYRSSAEAYVAAEEIEADGERVADAARYDGNEGKAEQARNASRELAEKIRAAARKADGDPEESEREPRGDDVQVVAPRVEEAPAFVAPTEPATPARRHSPRPPSRSELDLREAPPVAETPLTRLLAKVMSRTDVEESIVWYRAAILEMEHELEIFERTLAVKDAA